MLPPGELHGCLLGTEVFLFFNVGNFQYRQKIPAIYVYIYQYFVVGVALVQPFLQGGLSCRRVNLQYVLPTFRCCKK